MKKRILLAPLFLSLIMISTITLTIAATDYTQVGVKVGDSADYTYPTTTANGTVTERFRIEILQVAGTNVTIGQRDLYLNNSEGPAFNFTYDISIGTNEFQQYLVASNLGPGDNLNQVDNPSFAWWRIDMTTVMNVLGQFRTVNHAQYTGPIFGPNMIPGEKRTYSNELYYDKTTGLLVEMNITVTDSLPPYANETKTSYIQTLTSTTAFTFNTIRPEEGTIPLNTTNLLITTAAIAIVAVTMVAAAITQHRKQKTTTN
jgi:hypothetical protein